MRIFRVGVLVRLPYDGRDSIRSTAREDCVSERPGRSPRLRTGDGIGIVSPSWFGGEAFVPRALRGVRTLEAFGFRVKIAEHAFNNRGHVSDTAEHRAADLNVMFADPEVQAILCTIGGTHGIDVLPHLDLDLIRRNPKPFVGYSDCSTLNLALHATTGLRTINGPYLLSDWAEYPEMPPISRDWMLRLLMSPDPPGAVPYPAEWTREFLDWTTGDDLTRRRTHQANDGWQVLRGGRACGPLIGGCVECLELLKGSRFWPNLDGAILFLETAGDLHSPYATDELMASLELAGVFDRIAGLLFAKPSGLVDRDWAVLDELLRQRLSRYAFPVVTNMDFGHHSPMIAMPLGVLAELSTDPVRIEILESPVHG